MTGFSPPDRFSLPNHWPRAADRASAARLLADFAAAGRAEAAAARRPAVRALLESLGGNSPYLAELALRESKTLRLLVARGPDAAADQALGLIAATPDDAPRPMIAAVLRQAKRQMALAAAIADIGRIWRLDRITAALSDLAEAALGRAVGHLLHEARQAGRLEPDDRFTVLGMGKLGARELNYSSDVDLILLYDPGAHEADHRMHDGLGDTFTRIARGLVALMESRNEPGAAAGGYVFRTDLRLRPDPGATPPAISLLAAITYYESMGQNWERAAMLKARPVAGDMALGAEFLDAIRPFVWRRHLDFAAFADIHAMKRRIDARTGAAGNGNGTEAWARIAGHDLKRGQGGIREIEFLTQTLQLVWGGRDPALRDRRTVPALLLLARAGKLPRRAAAELAIAYRFLRTAEHRLQMVNDRQTHRLPDRHDALEAFALFLGLPGATSLAHRLLGIFARVQAQYRTLFRTMPDQLDAKGALDFGGVDDDPATRANLAAMGYENAAGAIARVRGWLSGHTRALRSDRARSLLAEMLPALLDTFARQQHPDTVLARFDALLEGLPAGVHLLSLFQHNPALLDRIAALLGAALPLAEHLARVPTALEGLLADERAEPPARLIRARLRDARDLEDAIAALRTLVKQEDFRIAIATLEGRNTIDRAGRERTALADAVVSTLLPRVLAGHATRYGHVRGGAMAVVLLGKAGGREMMAGSDLDLMLIYDHPEDVAESSGAKCLPASTYFLRASHAFVAALTAPGAEGPLYAVDMRLRPSGNKGPVAVSLSSFRRYHREGSWTWERMALTRARVVAGAPALRARVREAIAEAMRSAGPGERIRADAAAMRARIARDHPSASAWDARLRVGGQMEVEFIAQVLQLVHLRAFPHIASTTTHVALDRLARAGLLPARDAAVLIHADRTWRSVQSLLRLTIGRAAIDTLSSATVDTLLRALKMARVADEAGLRDRLDRMANDVRVLFERHVGAPHEEDIGE